jgi:hypothetical protein
MEDVDFDKDVVYVVGKGRQPRRVGFRDQDQPGPRPPPRRHFGNGTAVELFRAVPAAVLEVVGKEQQKRGAAVVNPNHRALVISRITRRTSPGADPDDIGTLHGC